MNRTRHAPHAGGDLFAQGTALPHDLVYVESFLSLDEERALLDAIGQLKLEPARYKAYVAKRRIASFGSRYDFDTNVLHGAPEMPAFLRALREKVGSLRAALPESFGDALVTEYQPGTSLGWHRDVPQFAIVVGISLASACRMRFRPYPVRENAREGVVDLDLAPRSLYVLQGDARWGWQHSIPPTPALRYSITFRTRR